jgi:uncharacterized membrane protein YbaN (DUF454 family)
MVGNTGGVLNDCEAVTIFYLAHVSCFCRLTYWVKVDLLNHQQFVNSIHELTNCAMVENACEYFIIFSLIYLAFGVWNYTRLIIQML